MGAFPEILHRAPQRTIASLHLPHLVLTLRGAVSCGSSPEPPVGCKQLSLSSFCCFRVSSHCSSQAVDGAEA